MLLFAEGFDDLSNATDLLYRATAASAASIVTGRGGSGKAAKSTSSMSFLLPANIVAPNQAVIGCAWDAQSSGGQWTCYLNVLNSSGSPLFKISHTPAGFLNIYNAAATLLATVPNFKSLNSYLEFKVLPGNPGHVTMRLDGNIVFDADGNFGADGKISGISTNSNNGSWVTIDDLIICDTTGTTNNDFLGDTRVISQAPNADGAKTEFTPSTGTSHYALVDETPPNADTDYVSATAANQTDLFAFPAVPASNGILRAVQVMAYAKSDAGGVDKIAGVSRVGTTEYPGAETLVQSVYQGLATILEKNPATGQPWTIAEVNAAQFGVKRTV